MALAYAPYPHAGTLGGASDNLVPLRSASPAGGVTPLPGDVIYPKGWGPTEINLTAEFQATHHRVPTAAETANLVFYRNMGNLASSEAKKGNQPQNRERDYWNYLGFAEYYINNLSLVDDHSRGLGQSRWLPGMQTQWQAIADRGNDIVNKKVEASKGFFSKLVSGIVHSPVMALVNPADAVLHKIVGDKAYYAVAKAIGGDKVEAALKAGNKSLADLSKGSTQTDLVKQGVEVAKAAIQEKLTPEQLQAVLQQLPPATAQAARDALAGKTPSTSAPAAPKTAPAQAPPRALDPPKRPAAAAPAATPLRALDPPKKTPAPPQKTAAPVSPSTSPVQASAVAPGAFAYAPYPSLGALSGSPAPDCASLGPPVTDMPHMMRRAGLSAVNGSGGRSRMVHGPDGNDYLFALEGGNLTARQCFSGVLGDASEVHSPTSTSTEVRSPTSTSTEVRSPTSTSTEAYTQGNMTVTVTGGAGAGATTVDIHAPPLNRQNSAQSKGAPKNAHENVNINAPRPSGPTAQENKSVNAGVGGSGFRYAPYALNAPPHPHGGHGGGHAHGEHHFSHGGGNRGGHSGWSGRGFPWNYVTAVQTCRTWGDPIEMLPVEILTAAREALGASGGRPTTVRGPDGALYLFAIEGKAVTARPCAAMAST